MSAIEFTGPAWAAIKRHATTRLAELRAELEQPGLADDRTRELRGAIAELKTLLALADAKPEMPRNTVPYA